MADVLLALSVQRQPGNADLPLGPSTGASGSTLVADVILDEPLVAATISAVSVADVDMLLDAAAIDSDLRYDVAVWRGVQRSTAAPHSDGRDVANDAVAAWVVPIHRRVDCAAAWTPTSRRDSMLRQRWSPVAARRAAAAMPFNDAKRCAATMVSRFGYPLRHREERGVPWADADERSACIAHPYYDPPRHDGFRTPPWDDADRLRLSSLAPWHGLPAHRKREWHLRWIDGLPVISLWPRPDHWTPPPPPPRVISPDLALVCHVTPDTPTWLALGRVCRATPIGAVVIPIRRVYIVIHDVELVRLPDNAPIPCSELAIDLDADAWAWGWRATIHGRDALDAIHPGADGEPVTVEARIDGYAWRLLAEEWAENREFGRRSVSVSGRGLSARLSAPWHLPSDGTTSSNMTIRQILEAHLPIGSGWTIEWAASAPDWLVPGGAWSWQGLTPIQAIHDAAIQHGLIVRPDRVSSVLAILPRYPVLPWAFDQADPQLVVPDSAIIAVERNKSIEAQANAVYVHGETGSGIIARVKRQYSAGDRVAATVTAPMITHADAARLVGGRTLAGQYRQPEIRRLTLPLGGAFALGNIGDLLHVNLDGHGVRGICNAVSVVARMADRSINVRQTLTLGESTPNVWAKFRSMLPEPPLLWGTVVTAHGDHTATVQLSDGGSMRVRGTGAVGSNVWIKDGRIEGQAPAFGSLVEIDV